MSSSKLLNLIIDDEGLRLAVYDDATGRPIVAGYTVVGNPTIGVGRLLTEDNGITHEEADYLLYNDVIKAQTELIMNYPYFGALSEVRRAVLTSMCFNLGLPRLKLFKKMLTAIEQGNWETASEEMLDSKWARQVGKRADRLAEMMRSDKWPDGVGGA